MSTNKKTSGARKSGHVYRSASNGKFVTTKQGMSIPNMADDRLLGYTEVSGRPKSAIKDSGGSKTTVKK